MAPGGFCVCAILATSFFAANGVFPTAVPVAGPIAIPTAEEANEWWVDFEFSAASVTAEVYPVL